MPWTAPTQARMQRGGWGPMGTLSAVVPLRWEVFAGATHAGPHSLTDPTAHTLTVGREWDEPAATADPAATPPMCSSAGGGGPQPPPAAAADAPPPPPSNNPLLHLQWLDGPMYLSHISSGWLGHPWHYASAVLPLWTARRLNNTALHIPRRHTSASHNVPHGSPLHSGASITGDDDGSAEKELLVTHGSGVQFPAMDYVVYLQNPQFEGLDAEGLLGGILGSETPGRKGRGLADLPPWQRAALRLVTGGGASLITRRTMAEVLGVTPQSSGTALPANLYDKQTATCAAAAATAEGGGEAPPPQQNTLPRLMCSGHGAVLTGLQPRLFAGISDAHAFRLEAWRAAGVLDARWAAARAAAAVAGGGEPPTAWEHEAVHFLRGSKLRRGAVVKGGGAAPPAAAPKESASVKWWATYPPRSITVIARPAVRSLQPMRPLRALLRHVGLPIRWVSGMAGRPWDEQVAIFSGTGILLSSHGGDLAGIPFLPPSASLIEAFPYIMDWEGYRHLADVVGVRYQRLAAPPPTSPSEGLDSTPSAEDPRLPTAEPADLAHTHDVGAYRELFEADSFEEFCENPQRVPSLDANLLTACNARSKNTAVEVRGVLFFFLNALLCSVCVAILWPRA